MDQQLKARLIGASVLVVLAVLLIPELLSARKPAADSSPAPESSNGTRRYVIDLGGAVAASARAVPTPAAPKPSAISPAATGEPVAAGAKAPTEEKAPPATATPAASTAVKPAPAAQVATATTMTAPTPSAAPKSVVTPASGRWAVQVGAFGSATSADKLIGELKRAGFSAYEAPLNRSGKTLHRVRVGPEAERAEADRLAARLKDRGLPATVVAND